MNKGQLEAGGATFAFSGLTGEVISTEQRSDTYTTGSSRTVVIDGTGGGSGTVSTTVIHSRDIWLRTPAGDEHHVRVQADLPIRTGQRIAIFSLRARKEATRRDIDCLASVYAPATDTYWTIRKLDEVATKLSMPNWTAAQCIGILLLWAIALGLCFLGVGVPIVAILAFVWWRRAQLHKKDAARILVALEAEHQAMINQEHDAWRRDIDRLRAPAPAATSSIEAAR